MLEGAADLEEADGPSLDARVLCRARDPLQAFDGHVRADAVGEQDHHLRAARRVAQQTTVDRAQDVALTQPTVRGSPGGHALDDDVGRPEPQLSGGCRHGAVRDKILLSFVRQAITYDVAFGGLDQRHEDPQQHEASLRTGQLDRGVGDSFEDPCLVAFARHVSKSSWRIQVVRMAGLPFPGLGTFSMVIGLAALLVALPSAKTVEDYAALLPWHLRLGAP